MIDGIRMFNEQDLELKKEVYSRDSRKKVRFNSNFDLYSSRTADWRDTLTLCILDSAPDPDEIPALCRKPAMEYVKYIKGLGETLFELLSEALGVQPDHLGSMACAKGCSILCHYYPPCPQPELAMGTKKHIDPGFLTLLLQNEISGLQVLHEGQWYDVNPIRGGLVVNIGDLLQIVSNNKLKCAKHRAIPNHLGPRITVVCFFEGHASLLDQPFGPIKELTSDANPPQHNQVLLRDYIARHLSSSVNQKPLMDYYNL